jgi:hypothetical protein
MISSYASARTVLAALACACLAASLQGCIDKEVKNDKLAEAKASIKAVKVLNNSPDNAVKSWWLIKDAGMLLGQEQCKQYVSDQADYSEKLRSVSDMPPQPRECLAESFERSIVKVDVESETRALVYARIVNTTPPEPGSVPTDADAQRKKQGDKYRYTLGRSDKSAGWVITLVENFPSWERDWTNVNPKQSPSTHSYIHAPYQ